MASMTVSLSVADAVNDSIRHSISVIGSDDAAADFDSDEVELVKEARTEKYNSFLKKWIEYGEYVTIEFDTVEGTAVVVEN